MSLKRTLVIGFSIIVLLAMTIAAVFIIRAEQQSLRQQLAEQESQLAREILSVLRVTDGLLSQQVNASMQLLLQRMAEQGELKVGEQTRVGERQVPDLLLGDIAQANNFALVDNLTQIMGGTATLFSRSANDYVRISTNVQTATGRAIGTVLDPNGAAIAAINQRQAFYGAVDILGNPFITGYEPLLDDNNQLIGIAYVGYQADIAELLDLVGQSKILQQGFIAVRDRRGNIRAQSRHISDEQLQRILISDGTDWQINQHVFTPWGYEVLVGIANADVRQLAWQTVIKIIGAGIILAGILLIILYQLINKLVLKPIDQIQLTLDDLNKGEGDLTQRLNFRGNNEIAAMAKRFDTLLTRIQHTISHVAQHTQSLAEQAQHMEQSAVASSASISQQNNKIARVSSALKQITVTADHVAGSVQEGEKQTQQILSLNSQLDQIIDKTTANAQQQIAVMAQSNAALSTLNAASKNIMKVLDVINGIAEQTNLLALNAAIEAARAGEQGRGFSVVADEVRLLASRTQASTGEIRVMINSLEEGVLQVEKLNNSYQATVNDSDMITRQAEQAVAAVNAGVALIQQKNSQILQLVTQQNANTAEVNALTQDVEQETLTTAELALRALDLSKKVGELSEQMLQLLANYRYR